MTSLSTEPRGLMLSRPVDPIDERLARLFDERTILRINKQAYLRPHDARFGPRGALLDEPPPSQSLIEQLAEIRAWGQGNAQNAADPNRDLEPGFDPTFDPGQYLGGNFPELPEVLRDKAASGGYDHAKNKDELALMIRRDLEANTAVQGMTPDEIRQAEALAVHPDPVVLPTDPALRQAVLDTMETVREVMDPSNKAEEIEADGVSSELAWWLQRFEATPEDHRRINDAIREVRSVYSQSGIGAGPGGHDIIVPRDPKAKPPFDYLESPETREIIDRSFAQLHQAMVVELDPLGSARTMFDLNFQKDHKRLLDEIAEIELRIDKHPPVEQGTIEEIGIRFKRSLVRPLNQWFTRYVAPIHAGDPGRGAYATRLKVLEEQKAVLLALEKLPVEEHENMAVAAFFGAIEGVPDFAAQIVASLAVPGGFLASLATFAGLGAAPVYADSVSTAYAETGDWERANDEARVNAGVTFVTNVLPAFAFLRKIPGGKQVQEKLAKTVFGRIFQAAERRASGRIAIAVAGEVTQDVIEQGGQELSAFYYRRKPINLRSIPMAGMGAVLLAGFGRAGIEWRYRGAFKQQQNDERAAMDAARGAEEDVARNQVFLTQPQALTLPPNTLQGATARLRAVYATVDGEFGPTAAESVLDPETILANLPEGITLEQYESMTDADRLNLVSDIANTLLNDMRGQAKASQEAAAVVEPEQAQAAPETPEGVETPTEPVVGVKPAEGVQDVPEVSAENGADKSGKPAEGVQPVSPEAAPRVEVAPKAEDVEVEPTRENLDKIKELRETLHISLAEAKRRINTPDVPQDEYASRANARGLAEGRYERLPMLSAAARPVPIGNGLYGVLNLGEEVPDTRENGDGFSWAEAVAESDRRTMILNGLDPDKVDVAAIPRPINTTPARKAPEANAASRQEGGVQAAAEEAPAPARAKQPWERSDLATSPNIPIGSVQAKKQADGSFKLFYIGTSNEVFAGEKFRSVAEARRFFRAQQALAQQASPAPAPAPAPGEVAPAVDRAAFAALGPGHARLATSFDALVADGTMTQADADALMVIFNAVNASDEFMQGVDVRSVENIRNVPKPRRAADPDKPFEPWEMTKAEFNRSRNQPIVDAVLARFKRGGSVTIATQMRQTTLSKPEHIRINKIGEIQTAEGRGRFVTLLDTQADQLGSQVGIEPVPLRDKIYHRAAVEAALKANRPVPAEVLADYPDLSEITARTLVGVAIARKRQSQILIARRLDAQVRDTPDADLQALSVFLEEWSHLSWKKNATDQDRATMQAEFDRLGPEGRIQYLMDGFTGGDRKAATYHADSLDEFVAALVIERALGHHLPLRPEAQGIIDRLVKALRDAIARLRARGPIPGTVEILDRMLAGVSSEQEAVSGQAAQNDDGGVGPTSVDVPPSQVRRGPPAERVERFAQRRTGNAASVILADGSELPVIYAVADADDLTPSHDARRNFALNEGGDDNERPYLDPTEGIASRAIVEEIASNPKPSLVLSDTPVPVEGPPVVSRDGVVYGGNGRTMGLQLAYSRGGTQADTYRAETIKAAAKFGLDASGIANPIIVRVLSSDVVYAPRELSRILNEGMMAAKTNATEAVSRASKISNGTAAMISAMLEKDGEPVSIREVLANENQAAQIIRAFVNNGAWSKRDIPRYTDANRGGALNEEGKLTIEHMLLARLIDDVGLIAEMTPGVRQKVMAALPQLIRAADTNPEVRSALKEAIRAFVDFKGLDLSITDYFFDQQAIVPPPGFGEPAVAAIVHALDTMGSRKFRQAADELIDRLGIEDVGPKLGFATAGVAATPQSAIVASFSPALGKRLEPPQQFGRGIPGQQPLSGKVATTLNEDAQRLSNGEPKGKVRSDVYERIRQQLDQEGGEGPSNFGRPIPAFESLFGSRAGVHAGDANNGGQAVAGPTGGVHHGVAGRGVRPGIRVAGSEYLPQPAGHVGPDAFRGGLDEHQQLGVNLAIDRFEKNGRGFLLADGPGVGKTRQQIAIAAEIRQRTNKPVLIITQSRAIIHGNFEPDAKAMGVQLSNFEVGTYADLRSGKIGGDEYGLVIFDEAHNLKNLLSAKSIAGAKVKAEHFVYATATPMDRPSSAAYFMSQITGRPIEDILRQLGLQYVEVDQKVGPPILTIQMREGVNFQGVVENIIKLRNQAITDSAMVRRDYPFFGDITLDRVSISDEAVSEQTLIDLYWKDRINKASHPKQKRNISGQRTMELGRWIERHKIQPAFDMAMRELDAGRSVIIVAEGVEQAIIKGLGKAVPGTLKTLRDMFEAQDHATADIFGGGNVHGEIKAFQKNNEVRVALMTPQSGGTGVNLDDIVGNAPRTMIVMTTNFSGDQFEQTNYRISRRNTASESLIRILHSPISISDNRRNSIIRGKMRVMKAVQEGVDIDRATPMDLEEIGGAGVPMFGRDMPDQLGIFGQGKLGSITGPQRGLFGAATGPSREAQVADLNTELGALTQRLDALHASIGTAQWPEVSETWRRTQERIAEIRSSLERLGADESALRRFGLSLTDLRTASTFANAPSVAFSYGVKQYLGGYEKAHRTRDMTDAEHRDAINGYRAAKAGASPMQRQGAEFLANQAELAAADDETGMLFGRPLPTDTPEFKKWFGASKVVDAKGRPEVVYHGTRHEITEFKPDERGKFTGARSAKMAFFFTDSPNVAFSYPDGLHEVSSRDAATMPGFFGMPSSLAYRLPQAEASLERAEEATYSVVKAEDEEGFQVNITEIDQFGESYTYDDGYIYDSEDEANDAGQKAIEKIVSDASSDVARMSEQAEQERLEAMSGANLIPAYLKMENPFVHDFAGGSYVEQPFSELIQEAIDEGHDGVIFENVDDDAIGDETSTVYAVFRPEQVKSATGNTGAFDPDNPDIRFGRALPTDTPEYRREMSKPWWASATSADFKTETAPEGEPTYISESGSEYWETPDGVYRRSDHWGTVSRSHWTLDGDSPRGERLTGFASWADFGQRAFSVGLPRQAAFKTGDFDLPERFTAVEPGMRIVARRTIHDRRGRVVFDDFVKFTVAKTTGSFVFTESGERYAKSTFESMRIADESDEQRIQTELFGRAVPDDLAEPPQGAPPKPGISPAPDPPQRPRVKINLRNYDVAHRSDITPQTRAGRILQSPLTHGQIAFGSFVERFTHSRVTPSATIYFNVNRAVAVVGNILDYIGDFVGQQTGETYNGARATEEMAILNQWNQQAENIRKDLDSALASAIGLHGATLALWETAGRTGMLNPARALRRFTSKPWQMIQQTQRKITKLSQRRLELSRLGDNINSKQIAERDELPFKIDQLRQHVAALEEHYKRNLLADMPEGVDPAAARKDIEAAFQRFAEDNDKLAKRQLAQIETAPLIRQRLGDAADYSVVNFNQDYIDGANGLDRLMRWLYGVTEEAAEVNAPFKPGQWVMAMDRQNYGQVVRIDIAEARAQVRWVNRRKGTSAVKWRSFDELTIAPQSANAGPKAPGVNGVVDFKDSAYWRAGGPGRPPLNPDEPADMTEIVRQLNADRIAAKLNDPETPFVLDILNDAAVRIDDLETRSYIAGKRREAIDDFFLDTAKQELGLSLDSPIDSWETLLKTIELAGLEAGVDRTSARQRAISEAGVRMLGKQINLILNHDIAKVNESPLLSRVFGGVVDFAKNIAISTHLKSGALSVVNESAMMQAKHAVRSGAARAVIDASRVAYEMIRAFTPTGRRKFSEVFGSFLATQSLYRGGRAQEIATFDAVSGRRLAREQEMQESMTLLRWIFGPMFVQAARGAANIVTAGRVGRSRLTGARGAAVTAAEGAVYGSLVGGPLGALIGTGVGAAGGTVRGFATLNEGDLANKRLSLLLNIPHAMRILPIVADAQRLVIEGKAANAGEALAMLRNPSLASRAALRVVGVGRPFVDAHDVLLMGRRISPQRLARLAERIRNREGIGTIDGIDYFEGDAPETLAFIRYMDMIARYIDSATPTAMTKPTSLQEGPWAGPLNLFMLYRSWGMAWMQQSGRAALTRPQLQNTAMYAAALSASLAIKFARVMIYGGLTLAAFHKWEDEWEDKERAAQNIADIIFYANTFPGAELLLQPAATVAFGDANRRDQLFGGNLNPISGVVEDWLRGFGTTLPRAFNNDLRPADFRRIRRMMISPNTFPFMFFKSELEEEKPSGLSGTHRILQRQ